MLDKSIPYLNIVMMRRSGTPIPQYERPQGYSFVPFTKGNEVEWAEIETSVGEFNSVAEALNYFSENYLSFLGEVERRTIFIQTVEGKKIGTVTSWWNYTGVRRDLALEWVAVKPEYQGLGLGKAVVFEGLRRMVQIEGDRDIFLHTQTWSYQAVPIYLQAGFEFMKSGTFNSYENDYEDAIPYLEEKLRFRLR
ncbi:GNAT family N-acetyltransferase [Alkaliphilus hydrothermalis]|uniref:Ribosomal protein S18 acetylase RimI-like enzyme n=1 Tax=Alkaliphilus hydrothermalis TaxID=1482730 RepID=A0ABS2NMF8_9FIRM|nr:GNAT family N-acetyltransferase [Alkaliphilus hydrothermalis]MBM7614131.1 ribosomal protein S18 acetylase RimI-like enzyme [Alkaliphilus hydrothermalis]